MELEGIYTPVVTPMDANGDINLGAYAEVLEGQLAAGIHGIIPGGSTGEYYVMTDAEREQIFRTARDVVGDRAQLIAGANATATRDVIRHGLLARELGYQALMLAPPYYSLPSQTELANHFRAVAEAVDLPIVLYNFPARAGVPIEFDCLDRLQDVPQIIAMKESSGEFTRLLTVPLRYGDRYQMVCGADDQAADYYLWGTTAWIAGSANALPREHVLIHEAGMRRDFDELIRIYSAIMPVLQSLESGLYIQKAKVAVGMTGIDVGDPRAPLQQLDDETRAEFEALMRAAMAASKVAGD